MRRFVAVLSAAVLLGVLSLHSPASALEAPAAPVQDPIAKERACVAAAQAAGAAPSEAAGGCLDPGLWGPVTPMTSGAGALAISCVQSVQTPYLALPLVVSWGTLVVCDKPMVSVWAGTLAVNGIPYIASAGPGTTPLAALQFWTTFSPCVLAGTYQSTVLAGVIVSTSGDVTVMGSATSNPRLISSCI